MKKNVFSTLSARAALALAASLLIGLSSCKKEKSGSKPDPVGDSVTMTTGIAVGGTINLWFAIGDEPSVEGADETKSKEEYGWLKKQYTLTAQNLVIKGKVTRLDCSDNTLTSLDVSRNTKLEILECSNNTLTSLDVGKNTKLEILYCYKNNITFEKLKLPELSANGNLYFKYTSEGDLQKLTKAQVEEIKKKKNWIVYQYKGISWEEYPGE